MTTERPWLATAREMRAQGVSYRKIADACGLRSSSTVLRALNPELLKGFYRWRAERRKRRFAEDPAYREQVQAARQRRYARRRERMRTDPAYRERQREVRKRSDLRAYARAEAAETGRPVEEIYAVWGVA